ncbi:MAG: hypothetical protein ACI9WC_001991 [Arenicella sp.]|jgi:hypothetical protein
MIRRRTNDLSIKPKISSSRRAAIIASALALVCVVVYLSYQQGIRSGNTQYADDRELITQLNESLNEFRDKLASSEQNLVVAQRHKQIQEEAYKQISDGYASAEEKNRYLGSRLDFYRSIISPEDGQAGPVIQSLKVEADESNIKFDVTLVQAIKHKHQVRGNLRVELYSGEELVAQWPDPRPRSINFQYFEQITGVLEGVKLSDNARIRVEFELQDGQSIERWFDVGEL